MSWATTRQILFALGVLLVVGAVGAAFYFSFFFTPASCDDGVQNRSEEGIDCGGECPRLCSAPAVSTLWARSVVVAPGVYHAVALVRNPDTRASGNVPYTVSLFDKDNILVAVRDGELALSPGETSVLFEANVITGERIPTRTFVDIGQGAFIREERSTPPVKILSFSSDNEAGRLTAVIENQTLFAIQETTVSALLFNESDILTDASQTVVENLGGKERREIVFTWQKPFLIPPTRIDIIPYVSDDRALWGF